MTGSVPKNFWASFAGQFSGVLDWSDVEALFQSLKTNNTGWYVYDMKSMDDDNPQTIADCPVATEPPSAFLEFLSKAEKVIYKRRSRPYCGAIYVDNADDPAFIKIFDPTKMGSSCSCSTDPVLPRWTVTRIKPEPPLKKSTHLPNPGFFARLTGLGS